MGSMGKRMDGMKEEKGKRFEGWRSRVITPRESRLKGRDERKKEEAIVGFMYFFASVNIEVKLETLLLLSRTRKTPSGFGSVCVYALLWKFVKTWQLAKLRSIEYLTCFQPS